MAWSCRKRCASSPPGTQVRQDENVEPLFGHPEQRVLPDASGVLLVERDVPDAHTLEAALQCGAALDAVLYEEKPGYAGYAWYDRLPRIVDSAVLFDGVLYDDGPETAERPAKIEIEITIAESDQPEERPPARPDSCADDRAERDQFCCGQ
ncbi:MAG TPA: hypothetical protein VI386_36455 [Candidatus Sulfotelmatobacter sp.]